MLLGSKWAATSPLKQKCSKKKYQKDCWGLFKLTKLHVQSIWKRAVENEWHFLPAWFISWKPWHEALLDLPGVNAVGQVTTWISKSILHSQAVSSLSWPLYDKKHFAKKQPYLLAQEINYWSRRGSLSALKQHSTFFFLSYFPLKLAALQKTSWRHPKKLLLLEKLPPSLSLLVHPSGLKTVSLLWKWEGSFITMKEKELKANSSFLTPPADAASTSASEGSPQSCEFQKILFWFGFFVAKNTTDNSGHSFSGNSITQLSWQFFVSLLSAAPLLLSSKCDKQCR